MNTQNKPHQKKGSALIVTLSVVAVAVLVLASYLITIQYEVSSVSRSQTWNSAISLAEAGMEEGMATIDYGSPSIIVDPYAWTNVLTSAGWTTSNGTNATLTRYVSGSNYYTVNITWTGTNPPTVTSAGVVSYTSIPWQFSALRQHSFLAQAGGGTSTTSATVTMGRKIQVQSTLSPLFSAGVVCRSNFDMSGNNCTIDSFDSTSVTYSTGGQWDVTKHKANGNVGTDSALVNSFVVGNGNIFGSVYTGPGTAETCVSVGPNGSVGDLSWCPGTSGIQAGHWFGNFNMNIPDVTPPNTAGWATNFPPAVGGSNILQGGTNYVVSSLPNSLYIAGYTVIWVQGSASLGVTIAKTNNAQLILFVGRTTGTGDSMSWSGNGTCNMPGYAANLQIYGLPSMTSMDLHGNAGWVGTLYAPEVSFVGGGGGKNAQDTAGAIVVHDVSLKGKWNFHYDESLAVTGPSRGWIATGWKEVPFTP